MIYRNLERILGYGATWAIHRLKEKVWKELKVKKKRKPKPNPHNVPSREQDCNSFSIMIVINMAGQEWDREPRQSYYQ